MRWRIHPIHLLIACLLVLSTAAIGRAESTCSSLFEQGRLAYEKLSYDQAHLYFNQALEQPETCSANELTRLHVLQAKIYLINNDEPAAVNEMKRALEIDPYLVADPFSYSPKVLKLLDQAREELRQEQNDSVAEKRRETTSLPADSESSIGRDSLVAWTLFGSGSALAVGAGVTLGLAYYEEAQQFDAADRRDEQARDKHYQNAKSYALAAGVSGTLSAITLGTAFYYLWQDNHHQQSNLLIFPETLWIAPVLWPEGAGVAAGFEF